MKSLVLTPRIARTRIYELASTCETLSVLLADAGLPEWRRHEYADRAERLSQYAFELSRDLAWMKAQQLIPASSQPEARQARRSTSP